MENNNAITIVKQSVPTVIGVPHLHLHLQSQARNQDSDPGKKIVHKIRTNFSNQILQEESFYCQHHLHQEW